MKYRITCSKTNQNIALKGNSSPFLTRAETFEKFNTIKQAHALLSSIHEHKVFTENQRATLKVEEYNLSYEELKAAYTGLVDRANELLSNTVSIYEFSKKLSLLENHLKFWGERE